MYYLLVQLHIIISDERVELRNIRTFTEFNALKNTKRQDYENSEFELTLEVMHELYLLSVTTYYN